MSDVRRCKCKCGCDYPVNRWSEFELCPVCTSGAYCIGVVNPGKVEDDEPEVMLNQAGETESVGADMFSMLPAISPFVWWQEMFGGVR